MNNFQNFGDLDDAKIRLKMREMLMSRTVIDRKDYALFDEAINSDIAKNIEPQEDRNAFELNQIMGNGLHADKYMVPAHLCMCDHGDGINWSQIFSKGKEYYNKGKKIYEAAKPIIEKAKPIIEKIKPIYDKDIKPLIESDVKPFLAEHFGKKKTKKESGDNPTAAGGKKKRVSRVKAETAQEYMNIEEIRSKLGPQGKKVKKGISKYNDKPNIDMSIPWMERVRQYRRDNPGVSQTDAMKALQD